MPTPSRSRGFTAVEVLIVVAMAGVLAAIGVPNFVRAQHRARHSEAIVQLKRLHAGLSTQAVKPTSIHVPGFDPPRGNRYSYHLGTPCTSYEDRSTRHVVTNTQDVCIGADTFVHPNLPNLFTPAPLPAVAWDEHAVLNGLTTDAGLVGEGTNWDYLAYAAGDLNNNPSDTADTWGIASADAQLTVACPSDGNAENVPAGEPFHVYDDMACN